MKKQNRVLKNIEFKNIIKTGKRFYTESFRVYFVKNKINLFQVGISISKKVSKSAVVRNKIKRQLLSAIKLNYNPESYFKVIIICNPTIVNKEYIELEKEVSFFLKKLGKEQIDVKKE
ncbi:MAG: ribonuclease P protein component [Mycoplasma sp.]